MMGGCIQVLGISKANFDSYRTAMGMERKKGKLAEQRCGVYV